LRRSLGRRHTADAGQYDDYRQPGSQGSAGCRSARAARTVRFTEEADLYE